MADTHKGPEINHQERIINPPAVVRTAESLGISEKTAGNVLKVSGKVSKTLDKPEIKKDEADSINWSKEERVKLKEELLIGEVRKKLLVKYPEQKDFFMKAKIKIMELGKDYQEHQVVLEKLGTNVFLLFGLDGKLLSYLDKDGNTLFDIAHFDFDDDFANLLGKKKLNKYFRKNDKGFLELYYQGQIFSQGTPEFNNIISNLYITGKLLYKKSR